MKKLTFFILLLLYSSLLHATTADELLHIHKVTTDEMNSISNPKAGSLVYNTTENRLYFYTGSIWKRMRSDGNETKLQAGSNITLSGNGSTSTPYIIGKP